MVGDISTDYIQLMHTLLNYSLENENSPLSVRNTLSSIVSTFYSSMYKYNPSINGYELFFLLPPHLSGYEDKFGTPDNPSFYVFRYLGGAVPFLASNISPPSYSVKTGQYTLRTGAIPIAEEVEVSPSFSVTYFETQDLTVYSFHSVWIEYIHEVAKGYISPAEEYIIEGKLDYPSAGFILKFTPDGKLTYFARVAGIYPTSLPTGDLFGNRGNSDITTISITYMCPFYDEFTYPELEMQGYSLDNPNGHPWLEDFREKIMTFLKYAE